MLITKNLQNLIYRALLIFAKFLAKMGSKFFGGLNQKSGSISVLGIKFSNSCKKNYGKILIIAEFIRRLVMD